MSISTTTDKRLRKAGAEAEDGQAEKKVTVEVDFSKGLLEVTVYADK